MRKKVIIVNGSGGVGKGEFVKALSKLAPVVQYSIIDPVKEWLEIVGLSFVEKNDEYRKALYDLKTFLGQWDIPYEYVKKIVNDFMLLDDYKDKEILCVDMRESNDIKRAVADFEAVTVLVTNNRVEYIISNAADKSVDNWSYDYFIENNGSLSELENKSKEFYSFLNSKDKLKV